MQVIDWTINWNKTAGQHGTPFMVRAVTLDPECRGRDNYDPETDAEVNAISLYHMPSYPDGQWRILADFHDVSVAQRVLSGFLQSARSSDD